MSCLSTQSKDFKVSSISFYSLSFVLILVLSLLSELMSMESTSSKFGLIEDYLVRFLVVCQLILDSFGIGLSLTFVSSISRICQLLNF